MLVWLTPMPLILPSHQQRETLVILYKSLKHYFLTGVVPVHSQVFALALAYVVGQGTASGIPARGWMGCTVRNSGPRLEQADTWMGTNEGRT